MFRYISKRTINNLNQTIPTNTNLSNTLILTKKFHTYNNTQKASIFNINNLSNFKLNKNQSFNFSFGRFNLYRFNKELNSRYTLKDYTKTPNAKEWLEKKKQTFRANLKINKLSNTLAQPRDSKKLELNPIFNPNKRKLNKIIRKKIMGNINTAESQDFKSLEERLFLKDISAQSLENLRKIKENKIFNKKLHELHEKKLALKLEGKKLENLIENFDFKFKNFEIYNDTEANSVKTYMLTDFVPAGKLNYGVNLNEKNPLKNAKYEAPYKIQTRFNEFIENRNQMKNLRIESLLSSRKSNPSLNKYLYAGENSQMLIRDKVDNEQLEFDSAQGKYEIRNNNEGENNDKNNDNYKGDVNSENQANELNKRINIGKEENANSSHVKFKSINLSKDNEENKNFKIKSKNNDNDNHNSSESLSNNNSAPEVEIIQDTQISNSITTNKPLSENNSGNTNNDNENNSIEHYFKKHIDIKSRINNYETELYNEFRNLDIYNKYQKGIVKFSELSLAENLNYVKFNLKNSQDLFKMYLELKGSDNPLVYCSMLQKLSTCLKNEKDVWRTLNLYEYKDLLRDFKKNFKIVDNKNFVDSVWALGKMHRNSREFSQKFFQHMLGELLDEAVERVETLKIEEIAFLCQGLVYLDISDRTDDLTVVAKKNEVLEKIYSFLINGELSSSLSNNVITTQTNPNSNISPSEAETDMRFSAFPDNSPITKLKYLHHASSILKCFKNLSAGLTNKNYVDLLNYFTVPLKRIIAERSVELIDEVDLNDFKNLISCYANGVSKLRFFVENEKEEDFKTAFDKEKIEKLEISKENLFDNLDVYKNNYNRSSLLQRLDRRFDTFINEKQFLKDEEIEIKSRVVRKIAIMHGKENENKENLNEAEIKNHENANKEENVNKENLERNIQIINSEYANKNLKLLENPKKNFLEITDFLTSATLYKLNKMEIKDTSEIMFSVANAKLYDYKVFLNKLRKKTLDELDKGKPFTLKQVTKYFWGLSQLNTKFFAPQFNLDFNSIVFPRLTKKLKSGSFVEINKVKNVIFEMKNVVDNKELSLLLYALANMGYADPEFFIPVLHNLIQYDKMSYLNSISSNNNNYNKNSNNKHNQKNFNNNYNNHKNKEFYFAFKDIAYYLNTLAFLNYNDEVLIKFFLNKLQNFLAPLSENTNNNNNNKQNILAMNSNNDLAISMLFASFVHLNIKRNLRNLKNWQLIINNLLNYCSANYTEKNAKNLTSIIWFMAYFDFQNIENFFYKFMNLISLEFNKLSKFDKVVLNESLLLLFLRHKITYKTELFSVERIRELNSFSLDFEKSRRIIQRKYAETHFETQANSDLVKNTLEKYSAYLLQKGLSYQKDYVIENSFIADAFIKQKNLLIEVYEHFEVLKDKELNGYNLLKQEIYEELGFKVLNIYANDFEFLIVKEDEGKLIDYLLEKIDKC